jgi:hypothetical protein
MTTVRPTRVLVVTDHAQVDAAVLEAVRDRATRRPVQFGVLVPNPTRGEMHLLHPERHEHAEQAERVLRACLPGLEAAAGGPVSGSVSIRNDPYEAVEGVLADEPVDEFLVSLHCSGLTRALHLDLPRRLAHFGLPITVVDQPAPVPAR